VPQARWQAIAKVVVRLAEIAFALSLPEIVRVVFDLPVPKATEDWFRKVLEVIVVVVVFWLWFMADEVKGWPKQEVGKKVLPRLTWFCVIFAAYFGVAKWATVSYTPIPGAKKSAIVVVPPHLTNSPSTYYLFRICKQRQDAVCTSPWDTAYSADDLAGLLEGQGEAGVMLEHGWGIIWSLTLLALYAGLVALLIYLFGLFGIRVIDKKLSNWSLPKNGHG